jgi:hypothetical protein
MEAEGHVSGTRPSRRTACVRPAHQKTCSLDDAITVVHTRIPVEVQLLVSGPRQQARTIRVYHPAISALTVAQIVRLHHQ